MSSSSSRRGSMQEHGGGGDTSDTSTGGARPKLGIGPTPGGGGGTVAGIAVSSYFNVAAVPSRAKEVCGVMAAQGWKTKRLLIDGVVESKKGGSEVYY